MSKDCRIVVRMSEDLRDWVHAQAAAREMDDAAYVRMLLAEARSGVTATRIKAETPLVVAQAQPIQRDVLAVATVVEKVADVETAEAARGAEGPAAPVDLNALVDAAFDDAEQAGLTQAYELEGDGEMPAPDIRPIFRRPVPFSPATQHPQVAQMLFGGR